MRLFPSPYFQTSSETDDLTMLQNKMQEYIDNGAALGWLIDPSEKQVYVYHPDQPMQQLNNPATLSGEPTLSGFVLNLGQIW